MHGRIREAALTASQPRSLARGTFSRQVHPCPPTRLHIYPYIRKYMYTGCFSNSTIDLYSFRDISNPKEIDKKIKTCFKRVLNSLKHT